MKFYERVISDFGGYEKCKDILSQPNINFIMNAQGLREHMLKYRRQHNIFEVGDYFVNYADDAVYTALSIDQNNHMHGKSGDKNVWTYFGRFGLRHATDEEIAAGKRLEVNQ